MKNERLFNAIGAADPELLRRSDARRQRNFRPLAAVTALAACLALALGAAWLLRRPPAGELGQASSTVPVYTAPPPVVTPPETDPPDSPTGPALELGGSEVGQLHLCRLGQSTATPRFVINVNRNIYATAESGGAYLIRPIDALPADFPVIDMSITPLPGVAPEEAAAQAAEALAKEYAQVGEVTEIESGLLLRAGNGDRWNDAQIELRFIPDGAGGCFRLAGRWFTEAEEGHGVRFRDMANTFRVLDPTVQTPRWLDDLYAVTDQAMDALFADRPGELEALLDADHSFVEGYGEDVSADVSVAAVDCAVDDPQGPATAVVSVTHRVSMEDSFNYLTLELCRRDDRWYLTAACIEK